MNTILQSAYTSFFVALIMIHLPVLSDVVNDKNDPSILNVETAKIDALFQEYDTETAPGCAVAIYHNGETIFSNEYGMSNLDYGIPIESNSVFYMASLSKQITAAAAGLLIIREEISLEEPVSTYFEEWPEWAEEVKISHLFNHTSGLPDIYDVMEISGISLSNVMSLDDYLYLVLNGDSLKFEPGSKYTYTNGGYTVLAALIENISDQPFSKFVEEEIIRPLGLSNTHVHDNRHRVIPNRVVSYAPGDDGFRQTYLSNFQGVGAGGIYSTTGDWQKWDHFWMSGQSISDEFDELKTLMLQRAVIDDEPLEYGRGLQINNWMGQSVIGHYGSFMGFKNDYRRFPGHDLSFLTLCNREDANAIEKNRELARLLLKDTIEEYLLQFAGLYTSTDMDLSYELTIDNGHLILNRRLTPNGPMEEEKLDHWKAGSWDFEFQRDDNGKISGFLLSTGRALNVEFVRQ